MVVEPVVGHGLVLRMGKVSDAAFDKGLDREIADGEVIPLTSRGSGKLIRSDYLL